MRFDDIGANKLRLNVVGYGLTPRVVLRSLVIALLLAGAGCSTPAATAAADHCDVSDADKAWINRSLDAWRFATSHITRMRAPNASVIFFDASCVLQSSNALDVNVRSDDVTWTATVHTGTVSLPDGEEVPAGVTSFAAGDAPTFFFVMSTPSVWSAGGVSGGSLTLETMMVAVFLHEASHLAQIGPYGARLGRLIEQNNLPEDFNDDSLQRRFQDDAEFAESVRRETELFEQAATAIDLADARNLAREARRLMRVRAERWFAGADAYWAEAEDIWITFEGAGQWIGYQWLTHPQGGGVALPDASARWMRNRWWSQTEGFAIISALDRIVGPRWRDEAYDNGSQTALEMLDAALGA